MIRLLAALAVAGAVLLGSEAAEAQIQLRLEWDWNTTSLEDGFRVERSLGSPTTGFVEIGTTSSGFRNFVDADPALVAGGRYCYRIRAFTAAGGNGPYSNSTCGVPGSKEALGISVTAP